MNAITDTPTLTPAQSLRKQIDQLATQLESHLSQIVSLLDVSMDTYPPAVADTDRRDLENATNLAYVALDRAREALGMAGRIEVLARHIPAEVTA